MRIQNGWGSGLCDWSVCVCVSVTGLGFVRGWSLGRRVKSVRFMVSGLGFNAGFRGCSTDWGGLASRHGSSPNRPPSVWCLVFDAWYLVSGVWCLVFVVCCLLFVVCCLLFVVCCLGFGVRCVGFENPGRRRSVNQQEQGTGIWFRV